MPTLTSIADPEFEIITAILAGDNSLELRVFTPHYVSVADENALTACLCRLMDQWSSSWKRYNPYSISFITLFIFILELLDFTLMILGRSLAVKKFNEA